MKRAINVIAIGIYALMYSIGINADSLDSLYNIAVSDNNINIEHVNKLMMTLHAKGDADSLYRFTENDNKNIIRKIVHLNMSYSYYSEAHYADAVKSAILAIEIAEKDNDKEFLSDALAHLGCSQQRVGNFEESINTIQRCLHVDSLLNDKSRLSSDYNNLAAICLTSGNISAAEQYILLAIEIEKSMKPSEKLDTRYGIACEIFNKAGKYDEALQYVQMAYDLACENKDSLKIARHMSQMADVYAAKEEYHTARKLYEGSIEILEKMGEKNSLCINYKQIGKMLLKTGDKSAALIFLKKGELIARETGNIYILQGICESIAEGLKKEDPSKSYEYLKEAMVLKDSINTDEMKRNADKLNIAMSQNKQADSNASDIIQKTIIIALIIIIVLLLFVLSRKKHTSTIITDKKIDKTAENKNIEAVVADIAATNEHKKTSIRESREQAENKQFLIKVTDFIIANMSKQKITIDLIASKMCMSRSAFIKKMSNAYGDSVNNFIIKVKMEKAIRLLKDTDKSVSEIATNCGFEDPSYFIRTFKNQFKMTPQQYRNLPK